MLQWSNYNRNRDTFQERVDDLAGKLKSEKNIDIPENMRFVGLEMPTNRSLNSGWMLVILATPPNFRPELLNMRQKKGNHSFLEKPICVRSGRFTYRTIVDTARQAQA